MREKNRIISLVGSISTLIAALNRKRKSVNKFVLQIDEIPVYITFIKISNSISKLIIQDVGNNKEKILRINFDDSIEHFLFLLSLIRDEYKQKELFTDKSQLI